MKAQQQLETRDGRDQRPSVQIHTPAERCGWGERMSNTLPPSTNNQYRSPEANYLTSNYLLIFHIHILECVNVFPKIKQHALVKNII